MVSGVVFNGHQETDPDTGKSGPAHKSPRGQSSLDRSGSLSLAAWLVSGNLSQQKEFQKQHPGLFLHLGERTLSGLTRPAGDGGKNGVQSMGMKLFVPL